MNMFGGGSPSYVATMPMAPAGYANGNNNNDNWENNPFVYLIWMWAFSMFGGWGNWGNGMGGGRGYGRSEYGGNDGGSSYASRDRDYRKERGRRGGREGECMQGLWMEIEELEKKSKKTPGFNMKNHLKKEFPDLDEEEVKVLSLFAEKGGMHQFARELGMEVDELYEVLMDVAEKVDMERR